MSSSQNAGMEFAVIILAFIIPPVSVLLIDGCGVQFWINFFLYIFTYFLGVIHALFVIATAKDKRRERELNRYQNNGLSPRTSRHYENVYVVPATSNVNVDPVAPRPIEKTQAVPVY